MSLTFFTVRQQHWHEYCIASMLTIDKRCPFKEKMNTIFETKGLPMAGIHSNMADLFEPKQQKTVHWSVPWSDLMMTMFILFVVLFVFHVSERGEFPTWNFMPHADDDASRMRNPDWENTQPVDRPPDMSALFQISKRALSTEGLQGIASVELNQDGTLMIALTSDVLFDSGRAELKSASMQPLKKVARIVQGTPYILNVIGHTDNVAISNEQFSSNWELSTARACVTAKYLIDEMGISPRRIYAAGRAEYDPIRPNHKPEGRAVNRRVEIIISKEKPYLNSDRSSFYNEGSSSYAGLRGRPDTLQQRSNGFQEIE